jgi:lipopolysaccharide/colanic/teichoic acid biosynthesis glycosyltransferase
MSFVGPRPERKYFIDRIMEINPDYEYIYMMRPGLTSMATIYNGYTDTMEKMLIRLQMDLDYLKNRSLWLDAKIVFTTVRFIIYGKKF